MGFSLVLASRGCSLVAGPGLLFAVASLAAEQTPGPQASVTAAYGLGSCDSWGLEHWLSSWGTQALLLQSMYDLPGLGIEPMSPALVGRILYHWTTRKVPR